MSGGGPGVHGGFPGLLVDRVARFGFLLIPDSGLRCGDTMVRAARHKTREPILLDPGEVSLLKG